MDLDDFVAGHILGAFMVFVRFGTAAMFLPGFGETYVNARARLSLAAVISIALYPVTPVPILPDLDLSGLVRLIALEGLVGLWIGLTARILFIALYYAGALAGYTSGLANALAPSLGSFEGATSVASAFLITALVLMFATDTHHVIIRALLFSYDMMPFGQSPMLGDMTEQMSRAVSASMRIGLTIAAPFIVLSLMINLGLGLANRAMPNLPVFFIAQSGLIATGFIVLAVAAPGMLRTFLGIFADWFGTFTI